MTKTAAAGWNETLSAVERQIGDCLSALDRYETAFSRVLVETTHHSRSLVLPAEDHVWDEKLAAASRTTDQVEALLTEQQDIWDRWRQSFAAWQGLIEQPSRQQSA